MKDLIFAVIELFAVCAGIALCANVGFYDCFSLLVAVFGVIIVAPMIAAIFAGE